jgi:hypothetical protein
MKKLVSIAATFAALTFMSSFAFAGSSAGYGKGGPLGPYQVMISQANASGELFRITGLCKSACTMFLSINNVCVERSALLKFHSGIASAPPSVRQAMAATYNSALRSYVEEHHFMDTPAFHSIPGSALIDKFGYKECPRK